jgi:hypothetical protein
MSPFMFPHYECAVFKDGLRAFDRKWYIVVGSVAVTILGTQQRLLILLLHFDSISCMPRATPLLHFTRLERLVTFTPGAIFWSLCYSVLDDWYDTSTLFNKFHTLGAIFHIESVYQKISIRLERERSLSPTKQSTIHVSSPIFFPHCGRESIRS